MVTSVRTSTRETLVYVAWECPSWVSEVRGVLGVLCDCCPRSYLAAFEACASRRAHLVGDDGCSRETVVLMQSSSLKRLCLRLRGGRRASTLRNRHRVRRGYVHGRGGGMLARRRRMHSIVLVDVLGCAKRRVFSHALTHSVTRGEWGMSFAWEGLGELLLRLWLAGEFLILWRVDEIPVS
ncbi:hypothetical protein CRG98_018372 [Punica granatum]|uniref:Uncharacterized protein n=1 Tax=Punica granatum TaxID=22663 RepID=A0A2I0JY18_PUNGR|nr:hypothetical protein CRG98_018372 [Punica granatum]